MGNERTLLNIMKRLIILLLLLAFFTNSQGSQNAVDNFARKLFNAVKNNDLTAFRALFITSQEVNALISKGLLVSLKDTKVTIDYFKGESYSELQKEELQRLRGFTDSDSSWDNTVFSSTQVNAKKLPLAIYYSSIKKNSYHPDTRPNSGLIDSYTISIFFKSNGSEGVIEPLYGIRIPANLTTNSEERIVLHP